MGAFKTFLTESDYYMKTFPTSFMKWFGKSKVVDDNGTPLKVYHGTKADIKAFDLKYVGKGTDAHGSGFYFASDPDTAGGYATDGGAVYPVFLKIEKPLTERSKPLTAIQIRKLLVGSPVFDDAIQNFGDVKHYGLNKVLAEAVDSYTGFDSPHQCMWTIQNDFWTDHDAEYLPFFQKVTGYDGVIVNHGSGGKFFVVFNPSHIKSAISNSGRFSKSADLTD